MNDASNPWPGKTEITRREFFEKCVEAGAMTFVFGGVMVTTAKLFLPPTAEARSAATEETTDPNNVIYGFLIDTTKCIGCGSCVRACKAENNVPDGYYRTWVEQYAFYENGEITVNSPSGGLNGFAETPKWDKPEHTSKPPVRGFFVPKLCNHCINTPCIQVCPVGASYKTKEGVVLVDPKRCIGCGYCVQACPFGSRFLNPETGIADKCTWCYHRITKGLDPACVVSCPAKARIFGNVSDPNSEISQLLASNRVQVLKSYLGTNPRTRYIGLDSEVI